MRIEFVQNRYTLLSNTHNSLQTDIGNMFSHKILNSLQHNSQIFEKVHYAPIGTLSQEIFTTTSENRFLKFSDREFNRDQIQDKNFLCFDHSDLLKRNITMRQ